MSRLYVISILVCVAFAFGAVASPAAGQASDDSILAYAVTDGFESTVYLMDISSRISIPIETFNTAFIELSVSPDGRLVISVCEIACELWLLTNDDLQPLTETSEIFESSPDWSADGRLAHLSCREAYAGCDILLWDGQTSTNITNTPDLNERYPSWSADGRLAFAACAYPSCEMFVWDGQQTHQITDTPERGEQRPLWSPDGHYLFFQACWDVPICDLKVWDGVEVHHLGDRDAANAQFAWSPSNELAIITCQMMSCDLWLWDAQASQLITHLSNARSFRLAWNGDNQLLFSECSDNNLCTLSLWDRSDIITLADIAADSLGSFAWSANGELAISACDAERYCDLLLWDGQQITNLTNTPSISEDAFVWMP